MDRQIITFEANEQTLIKTGGLDNYSSNKVSYIEAHFALRQNWAGYDSVRAVWSTRYECISTVLDTEGICVVPYEVLKWKDKVMVNLVGSISEDDVLTDRITTYPIKALEVDADAKVCGSNTQPITPSEYEQFVEAVKADADRAEEAKDEARVYAGNALSSAQNALISETNASASEDNAKASELNAETYKNQAQTYAQNANNSAINAENAKDEAEDARDTILGMRAEATTLPEGSSATASYNDGVMSFGIPKGDTGARGATGETGATPQLSIGTVETTTEPSVTITGTAENPVLNFGLVKGDKGDTGEVSLADLSTLLPTDTASGSIASFPDGQSVIPALSVVADIEPIQSGSGTPSPDNIRPISGHDEVNVSVCGKNLFSVSIPTQRTWAGDSTDAIAMLNSLPIGTYTLTSINTITEVRSGQTPVDRAIGIWPRNTNISAGTLNCRTTLTQAQAVVGNTFTSTVTFTIDNDSKGNFTHFFLYSGDDKANVTCTFDIQLEVGTTATDYEPYQGTTYEVSFGTAGTVYGGTLDVVSGVLTVNRASKSIPMSSGEYNSGIGALLFYSSLNILSDAKAPTNNNTPIDAISDAVEVKSASAINGGAYGIGLSTSKDIYLKVSGLSSKADYVSAFPNGVQIVYELATPQTYQLTPTEVQTLLGQNNIWNDCGDTEVTYKADVTKWVEKQLS